MHDDRNPATKPGEKEGQGFLATLFVGLLKDLFRFVLAFAVGSGAGAIVCWYYGIPLIFALLGGILVLVLVMLFSMDSFF